MSDLEAVPSFEQFAAGKDFAAECFAAGNYETVDASGLCCPEPVMLLHKAVKRVESGGLILVLATDPSTERDIPRFSEFLRHPLLAYEQLAQDGGVCFRYLIQRRAG